MSSHRSKGAQAPLTVYVLSTILNRSPEQRQAVSGALKDDDFAVLVAAASDDDKTIRLQAAEFLCLLADPRAVPHSIDAARDTTDNNKASNQITIIGRSVDNLSAETKRNALRDLERGPGANNDLVGNHGFVCKTLFGGC
jgi:hypothetical protein